MGSQKKQEAVQTRFIEDLRGDHDGQEICIIGCGEKLDDVPDDFFYERKNGFLLTKRITIALNWAIDAFPECTYWHGHHECFREYFRDERPEFLPKSIILYPFPGPYKHGRISQPKDFFGDLVSKPIWMKFWDTRPMPKSGIEHSVKHIVEKQTPPRGYRACHTVAHTAVEAAAIMGASRITLIACERPPLDGRIHAQQRGMRARYGSGGSIKDYLKMRAIHEDGTRWLAELLGQHGIEVIYYHCKDTKEHKKGYEKIETE